ncbi:helicase-related protein [Sporanaerobium hydrogeniformans]|uniref:helicase-related protein n=1 Tax=Sporanaerobium hydrogeniformans TaxID=3072179 RepID=UPI002FE51490
MGFCSSKAHAEYMVKYFKDKGVLAAAVYSGEQGEHNEERNDALNKLKKGELKIIFSVDMFNEGVDVPAIDTVLFLRPTESPTVFLQQLGRGLRPFKDKEYLNVLDFIGNYKKASLIPFLLSGKEYESKALGSTNPMEMEFPDDCQIDFDFRLIDLFKKQAESELSAKDKILSAYQEVKQILGHRPSRVELFLNLDDEIIGAMKKNAKLNFFRDYLGFLYENKELTDEESLLYHSRAKEFLGVLETTSMSKSYKMPILKAFYNEGDIKMAIDTEDVYQAFKDFYSHGSNGVDMLRHKSTAGFKTWGQKEYVKLAKDNPIKFLKQSASDFFKDKEGYEIALADEIEPFTHLESFKMHYKDIVELRVLTYYKERLEAKEK